MIVQVRVVLNRVTCNQAYIFSEYAGRRLSLGLLLMKVPGRFSGNRALSSLKARIRGSEFFCSSLVVNDNEPHCGID